MESRYSTADTMINDRLLRFELSSDMKKWQRMGLGINRNKS